MSIETRYQATLTIEVEIDVNEDEYKEVQEMIAEGESPEEAWNTYTDPHLSRISECVEHGSYTKAASDG